MVARSKTYKGMRDFVDALDSIRTNRLYRITSQRSCNFGLRRSTFATTSAAQQSSTSSESAVSSTGICKANTGNTRQWSPKKPWSLEPKYRQRANAFHESTFRTDEPVAEAKRPAGLPETTLPASFWDRVNESSQGSPTDNPAESADGSQLLNRDFLDDWLLNTVKEKGWLLTWSFIPPDEASSSWFVYYLSRPDTAEAWTVSIWEETEEQARMKAYHRIFARIYGTHDWPENPGAKLSASETYLRCLKMILEDRLVLKFSRARHSDPAQSWFKGSIHVPEMEKSLKFIQRLRKDRETSTVPLSSVIQEVASLLRKKGIWQSLLKVPSQSQSPSAPKELISELGDIIAARPTEPEPEPEPETTHLSEPLSRQSIKTLLKTFFKVRGRWPERFHDEMASVNIQAAMQTNEEGVRTCRAFYDCNKPHLDSIEGDVVLEPSKAVPMSQLESMAIDSLLPKLEHSGIWDVFLEANHAPSLFFSDDIAWRIKIARSDLNSKKALLRQTFLKDEHIRQISDHRQSKPEELDMRLREIQERSENLTDLLKELEQSRDPEIVAIQSARAELPVSQRRNEILEMINQHTYSIVSAETGSGKSTQIPQIILDDAIRNGRGGECRVLCVQPRRIAAELLGNRVAVERNEVVGKTVGYEVRFNYKSPTRHGSILYCTTGIFLNMLADNRLRFESLTHILLDEVHVRDMDIDFVMLLLKLHVDQCRSTGARVPHIVIMSATVDQDLFSSYFRNIGPDGELIPAPSLSIAGRQYHVKQHYLDEILEELTTSPSFTPNILSRLLAGGDVAAFLNKQYQQFGEIEKPDNPTSISIMESPAPPLVSEDDTMPLGLISALVFHLLTTTKSGSILIFLPGLAWIDKLHDHLLYSARGLTFKNGPSAIHFDFSNNDQFRILRLHSELREEMEDLAEPFPDGCRRILLSTDIAEASVTLPDVSYVIDSGRLNEASYEPEMQSRQLACCWAGKTNVIQRAGRAGRVQNGEYYFLGTKRRYDSLQQTPTPEIKRGDLHPICLRAKRIAPDVPVVEILQQAIEPPSQDKVRGTVKSLKLLKAFDESESLTSLGHLLSRIGLNPHSAKLVILGLIFRCLDPLLVLAVQRDTWSLFQVYDDDTAGEISASKKLFAAGSQSDPIAEINAFIALRTQYNRSMAWDFAASNHLSMRIYYEIYQVAGLVLRSLNSAGLVSRESAGIFDPFGGHHFNVNSNNIPLLKSLIAHCSPGQIALPHPTQPFAFNPSPATKGFLKRHSLAESPPDEPRQILTYSSTKNFHEGNNTYTLLDASPVTPFILSLLGENLVQDGEMLRVDSWLPLQIKVEHDSNKGHAAHTLVELNEQFHKHLEMAYDSLHAKRWGMPMDRRHVEYSKANQLAISSLRRILVDLLSLDERPVPQARPWDTLEKLGEDFEDFEELTDRTKQPQEWDEEDVL